MRCRSPFPSRRPLRCSSVALLALALALVRAPALAGDAVRTAGAPPQEDFFRRWADLRAAYRSAVEAERIAGDSKPREETARSIDRLREGVFGEGKALAGWIGTVVSLSTDSLLVDLGEPCGVSDVSVHLSLRTRDSSGRRSVPPETLEVNSGERPWKGQRIRFTADLLGELTLEHLFHEYGLALGGDAAGGLLWLRRVALLRSVELVEGEGARPHPVRVQRMLASLFEALRSAGAALLPDGASADDYWNEAVARKLGVSGVGRMWQGYVPPPGGPALEVPDPASVSAASDPVDKLLAILAVANRYGPEGKALALPDPSRDGTRQLRDAVPEFLVRRLLDLARQLATLAPSVPDHRRLRSPDLDPATILRWTEWSGTLAISSEPREARIVEAEFRDRSDDPWSYPHALLRVEIVGGSEAMGKLALGLQLVEPDGRAAADVETILRVPGRTFTAKIPLKRAGRWRLQTRVIEPPAPGRTKETVVEILAGRALEDPDPDPDLRPLRGVTGLPGAWEGMVVTRVLGSPLVATAVDLHLEAGERSLRGTLEGVSTSPSSPLAGRHEVRIEEVVDGSVELVLGAGRGWLRLALRSDARRTALVGREGVDHARNDLWLAPKRGATVRAREASAGLSGSYVLDPVETLRKSPQAGVPPELLAEAMQLSGSLRIDADSTWRMELSSVAGPWKQWGGWRTEAGRTQLSVAGSEPELPAGSPLVIDAALKGDVLTCTVTKEKEASVLVFLRRG